MDDLTQAVKRHLTEFGANFFGIFVENGSHLILESSAQIVCSPMEVAIADLQVNADLVKVDGFFVLL